MVRGIREVLSLKAERIAVVVLSAFNLAISSIKEVTGVKLDTRKSCLNLENNSGLLRECPSTSGEFASDLLCKDKGVVITSTNLQLLVVVSDAFADDLWLPEVEVGSRDRADFASWDHVGITWEEPVTVDLELGAECVAVAAFKVEEGVVGDAANGWAIGCGVRVHDELVVLVEGPANSGLESAWEAVITVW